MKRQILNINDYLDFCNRDNKPWSSRFSFFSISVILINASTIPIFIYTNAKCFFNLKQNEVSMRMLKADPQSAPSIFNLLKDAKDEVTNLSRKDIKSLTQTYTGNTSVVAILITLPGGYITDAGNEGPASHHGKEDCV